MDLLKAVEKARNFLINTWAILVGFGIGILVVAYTLDLAAHDIKLGWTRASIELLAYPAGLSFWLLVLPPLIRYVWRVPKKITDNNLEDGEKIVCSVTCHEGGNGQTITASRHTLTNRRLIIQRVETDGFSGLAEWMNRSNDQRTQSIRLEDILKVHRPEPGLGGTWGNTILLEISSKPPDARWLEKMVTKDADRFKYQVWVEDSKEGTAKEFFEHLQRATEERQKQLSN